MNKQIYITGGAGFIGSNLVSCLNKQGIVPTIFERLNYLGEKWQNLVGLDFELKDIHEIYFSQNYSWPLVHLAANVSTEEKMNETLWRNNVELPLRLFSRFQKIIYASSASVYGNGNRFDEKTPMYPTNAYGFTKSILDKEVEKRFWSVNHSIYGLRFFNVYAGPKSDREKHKGPMESFVSRNRGKKCINVYKTDPEARRDFVWVKDVCKVIYWFLNNSPESGIYNVGSGKDISFKEIAQIISPGAEIIDSPLPEKMKDGYQFFSQADLTKLRWAGYIEPFKKLEEVYNG